MASLVGARWAAPSSGIQAALTCIPDGECEELGGERERRGAGRRALHAQHGWRAQHVCRLCKPCKALPTPVELGSPGTPGAGNIVAGCPPWPRRVIKVPPWAEGGVVASRLVPASPHSAWQVCRSGLDSAQRRRAAPCVDMRTPCEDLPGGVLAISSPTRSARGPASP